jgi:TPR repeat
LEAEKAFNKAVEIKPDFLDAKTELGNVYVSLKMFPEAILTFNQVIAQNPNLPNSQLGLGNAYYNNNRFAESIPFYKKAAELSPTWATAHLYMADAYYKTKQFNLAIPSYKTALSLDNQRADAHYGLGLTYVAQKDKLLAQRVIIDLDKLDKTKANLLQNEINKITGSTVIAQPVKSAQRIKDEQDVAKMADFGFDGAVVTQVSTVRETPKATGKLLLSVKRGDILSLVVQDDINGWFQVVDEKTGTEGWIDGRAVVIKLTNNKVTGPPLLDSGTGTNSNANPILLVSNLEEKTTLSLRVNGTLYQIPPKSTKSISVPPGKMNYYGWSAGIRPAIGSSNVEKGRQYTWSFKINRR